jgi:hypothetical protein
LKRPVFHVINFTGWIKLKGSFTFYLDNFLGCFDPSLQGYHFVSTAKLTSHELLYRNCINITNMWHFLEMLDYNHWNSQRIKKATLQQKVNTQLTSHGLLYRNCTNNTNMWHFLPRKRYNWKKLKKINLTKWDSCNQGFHVGMREVCVHGPNLVNSIKPHSEPQKPSITLVSGVILKNETDPKVICHKKLSNQADMQAILNC